MTELPYQPSPVNINSLGANIYMVDYATYPGNFYSPPPTSNWIIRVPTATDSKTLYIDSTATTFTVDNITLSETNVGITLLVKDSALMYAPVPTTPAQKVYVPGPGATANVPYPPNVPGSYFAGVWIETYPERAIGDAPAYPPATATYDPGTPWTATFPAVTTGGCSPYNYYVGHPYRDTTVIDITPEKYGIYQFVNYQADYPATGVNRFTFVRTKESLGMQPGSIIYIRSGIQNGGQIFIVNSNDCNFTLGYSGNQANVTLTGTYTISTLTTTVLGAGGADPTADGLVANDIVLLYGMRFKVISVPTDAPVRFIIDKVPQYSKSGLTVTKVGSTLTFAQSAPSIPDPLTLNAIDVADTTVLATTASSTVTMGQAGLVVPGPTPSIITINPFNTLDLTNVTIVGPAPVLPNPILNNVRTDGGFVSAKYYQGLSTVGAGDIFMGSLGTIATPADLYVQTSGDIGAWPVAGGSGEIILRTRNFTTATQRGNIRIYPGTGFNFIVNSIISDNGTNLSLNAGAGGIITVDSASTFNQDITVNVARKINTVQVLSPGNLTISATSTIINFSGCNLTNILSLTSGSVVTPSISSAGGNINFNNNDIINLRDVTMNIGRTLTTDNITSHAGTPLSLISPGIGNYINCSGDPLRFFEYIEQTATTDNKLAGTIVMTANVLPGINCSGRSISGVSALTFSSPTFNTTLAGYLEGTMNMTYSGPWAVNQTSGIRYTVIGKNVTINFQALSVAYNAFSNIVSTTFLPASIRPTDTIAKPFIVVDNAIINLGAIVIFNTGQIIIFSGSVPVAPGPISLGVFTGPGDCGFAGDTVSYNLGAF